MTDKPIPKFSDLMYPTLKTLKALGGSAALAEINAAVIRDLKIPENVQNVLLPSGTMTVIQNRLGWARAWLKKCAAVENSQRGVWSITAKGSSLNAEDMDQALKEARRIVAEERSRKEDTTSVSEPEEAMVDWQSRLLKTLTGHMSPSAFERLSQRLLRESGFTDVEVTGKSGDGGIDGYGTLKIGLLSFKVLFQCKRYQGSVSAAAIRDFRGAMQGRSEKGLFITTGSFTASAQEESRRDGAPPIDLMDGADLCDQLRKLGLGVKTETREDVLVDESWFKSL